jgi:membrane protein implicated in regulation of membrane protease activity
VTGSSDDEEAIMATFGASPGSGSFAHELVTTPGMLAIVDGVIAGVLAGILSLRAGWDTPIGTGAALTVGFVTVALLAVYQYRGVIKPRGRRRPRFPGTPPPA